MVYGEATIPLKLVSLHVSGSSQFQLILVGLLNRIYSGRPLEISKKGRKAIVTTPQVEVTCSSSIIV